MDQTEAAVCNLEAGEEGKGFNSRNVASGERAKNLVAQVAGSANGPWRIAVSPGLPLAPRPGSGLDSGAEAGTQGGDNVAIGFEGYGVEFGGDDEDVAAGIEGVGARFDSLFEDIADFCFEAADAGSPYCPPEAAGDVDAG